MTLRSAIKVPLRVLFLRSTNDDYRSFNYLHLAVGLVCTWLVGMGRHWDNPRVDLPLSLGVGSLAYVFVLALLLFTVGLPFRDKEWTYRRVLTMVVLSAPPAVLYAVPVERWMDFETARSMNLWFLAIVAAWRMLIWGRFVFLMLPAQFNWITCLSVVLMPVSVIAVTLIVLNLEKAVVDFMAGLLPPPEGTTADEAYQWLIIGGVLSLYVLPVVAIAYIASWVIRWKKARNSSPTT